MKGLAVSFLGMLVMACSGCGGGGEEESAPPTPITSKPEILIDAYGDSTMWGYDPEIDAKSPTNPPAAMQTALRNDYKLNVTVTNHGVSGSTLKKFIEGTDGQHQPWESQARLSNARYVIINFGLNDVLESVGESPDEYRELLSKFVAYARQAGKIPVFDEPTPTCDPLRQRLPEYIAIMRDVAKAQSVYIIPNYDDLAHPIFGWKHYVAKDCVHPNSYMSSVMGHRMANVMAPILSK